MNARQAASLTAVAVMALLAFLAPIEEADAEGQLDGVLISEFSPFDWEGVTIKNYGSSSVDLNGYRISDGEGDCRFVRSYTLAPMASVTVVRPDSTSITPFADREGVLRIGSSSAVSAQDSYVFSNGGDQVYLYSSSGKCVDAICYGNKSIDGASVWRGASVSISGNNAFIVRVGTSDTDTAKDWAVQKGGWTANYFDPALSFDAKVTPFVFPDSGGVPVFDAISSAKKSVHIEIYQLNNANMYALLCDLARSGVDVVLLMEAEPNSYGHSADIQSRMKALVNAGGEVKLIGGLSGERFTFVHAKYAIVDGTKTVVTSENWTADNLNGAIRNGTYSADYGNRGWGVVIESEGYASYMEKVFQNDLDDRYGDVRDFSEMGYSVSPANLRYRAPASGSFPSYTAKVCPLLSPDNSWDSEMYWIEQARDRVYVQQQSIGNSYTDWTEPTSPLHVLNSVADGLDARLIISSGQEESSSSIRSYVDRMNSGSSIKAAAMDAPYVHNKGLVCDDVSIVASVNWTSNSFFNNRESGVAIFSDKVADYFAGVFMDDFQRYSDYTGPSVSITTTQKTYELGEPVTFAVSVSPSGSYTYEWDFGDGQTKTTSVPSATFVPKLGAHVLRVTATDPSGQKATASMDYVVVEAGSDLKVSLSPSASKVVLGDPVTITATATPSGSYTYEWSYDGKSTTTSSPSLTYTPSRTGSQTVSVAITDASGGHAEASTSFSVADGAQPEGRGGLPITVIAALVVVLLVAGALVKLTKKK